MAQALTGVAKQIPPIVTVSVQQQMVEVMPHMAQVANHLSHAIDDSTDVIWPFLRLGRFYQTQSLWPEAEHWRQACLTMTEQRFGPDHPSTATSLNNLAFFYVSVERYQEAEPMYIHSLEIKQSQLGNHHPSTAIGLGNLAFLYGLMGRYREAESLYIQALEINFKLMGQDHPQTQGCIGSFADCLKKTLDANQTDQLSDHPLTQTLLKSLS